MIFKLLFLILLGIFSRTTVDAKSPSDDEYEDYVEYETTIDPPYILYKDPVQGSKKKTTINDLCIPTPAGGVDWILSTRLPDYGWHEETHRAVIALAVNGWETFSTPIEIRHMKLQLDMEITKNFLHLNSSAIHPNDLALYIHALIATRRNPHDFYGVDLVARLELIVEKSKQAPHPFLLLVLCNSHAFTERHLELTRAVLINNLSSKQNADYLAMALLAFECAKTLEYDVDNTLLGKAQSELSLLQHSDDGSFGNVYTTSLIVQALTSADNYIDKGKALEYLRKRSTVEVNMVSTYMIQLALHADRVPFIKDLYPDSIKKSTILKQDQQYNFVQYSLRTGRYPDVYFTMTIKVAPHSNFFEVMKLGAQQDSKFNFSYVLDEDSKPSIYSISGIPNVAEENLYWRLCFQSSFNLVNRTSRVKTHHGSPAVLKPNPDDHMIYWYLDSNCEET